jgi:hypothetical protein
MVLYLVSLSPRNQRRTRAANFQPIDCNRKTSASGGFQLDSKSSDWETAGWRNEQLITLRL